MKITTTVSGLIILYNDKPLDFRAVSSLLSAKLPKVIKEESKMASGKAKGIKLAETYNSNSRITQILNPLPIKSSMYTQKNCIIRMNIEITNVIRNGPIKDRMLNR